MRAFLIPDQTQLYHRLERGPREPGFAHDPAGGGSASHPTRAEGGVLRTYDLEIDTATRTVTRAGERIRLTPREYALLEFLAHHRGRVVSRAVIWSSIYGDDEAGTSNVIDVYIRYLRRKIDRGFDPPLIMTRRGAGYMLRADEA